MNKKNIYLERLKQFFKPQNLVTDLTSQKINQKYTRHTVVSLKQTTQFSTKKLFYQRLVEHL